MSGRKRTQKPKSTMRVLFSRHSHKEGGALSEKGKAEAFDFGKKGNKWKVKYYSTPMQRGLDTAVLRKAGRESVGKEVYSRVRVRKEMDSAFAGIDKEVYTKVIGLAKQLGEAPVARAWLEKRLEKIDSTLTGKLPDPSQVARNIIKKRLGLGMRIKESRERTGKEFEPIEMHAVSHNWALDAVFRELTGITPRIIFRPNESMSFSFEGKKVFLRYRKRKYDVTRKLNQILKKK